MLKIPNTRTNEPKEDLKLICVNLLPVIDHKVLMFHIRGRREWMIMIGICSHQAVDSGRQALGNC